MDRRDFLKLFAITAAGIYIPKKSYFFMPRPKLIEIPVMLGNVEAVFEHGDSQAIIGVPPSFGSISVNGKEYKIMKSKLYTVGTGRDEVMRKLMVERALG